jgi:catechol 2,3-dioxygenase-like lactoylglutathione lyase family enzyme
MVLELNHVGIQVKDADEMIEFYKKHLDAQIISEAPIPATKTRCVYMQIINGMIEFLCRGDGQPVPKLGYVHVAFIVDDVDAAYNSLSAAGYKFLVLPKVAGSGRGRLAFFSDPNGVKLEIIQREDTFRIPKFQGKQIHSFDHISLVADNLVDAEKLYVDFMGMKVLKKMRIDARDLDMVYLSHGDDVIELLHRSAPQNTEDLIGHLAFRVESVDRTAEKLSKAGVTIEPGSPKNAGTGIGRVCVFRDPEGNKIELVDRKDLRDL